MGGDTSNRYRSLLFGIRVTWLRSIATQGRHDPGVSSLCRFIPPDGLRSQSAVANVNVAAIGDALESSATSRTVTPGLVASSNLGGEAESANSSAIA
jgi:hypothetical protein